MRAYHGVHDEHLPSVLADGLLIARTGWSGEGRFWHLSLAQTPGIAAAYGVVLEVDLAGLDLPEEGFVDGELRMHEDISPGRLTVLEPQPRPDLTGFNDPGHSSRGNHPTCLRLRCWEHPPQPTT